MPKSATETPSPKNNYSHIDAESFAAMSPEDRSRYYAWLYQATGQVMAALVELRPATIEPEEWVVVPEMSSAEWWYYNTAHSAIMTVMDAFSGLSEMLSDHEGWSKTEDFDDWGFGRSRRG